MYILNFRMYILNFRTEMEGAVFFFAVSSACTTFMAVAMKVACASEIKTINSSFGFRFQAV